MFLALLCIGRFAEPPLLLRHVNVISCASSKVQRDVDVMVRDGRIESIGRAPRTIPTGAIQVDGSGKFLIPGLWDMHVHGTSAPGFAGLYLANGVTGVRDMFDPSTATFELRKKVEEGSELGPHIVAAGKIVDGPKPIWAGSVAVSNAEDGKKAVARVLGEGSDFVKVYSLLPRDGYFAIAEECRQRGAVFAGHVPEEVSAEEASDAGQKSFEHLYGILKGCSSQGEKVAKSRLLGIPPAELRPMMRALLETYDERRAQRLFAKLKKNGSWQCPTLSVLYTISYPKDPRAEAQYRFDYVPAWLKGFWATTMTRYKDRTSEDDQLSDRVFRKDLELVGKMQKAGVPILAGTDVMNPYCFPGFSLHDELGWLVKSGLTPYQALRAATINPARYLGRSDVGTVEKGKVADLVLLDANPLEDIHNSTRIRAVVRGGRYLDRSALDGLMPKSPQPNSGVPPVLGGFAVVDDPF